MHSGARWCGQLVASALPKVAVIPGLRVSEEPGNHEHGVAQEGALDAALYLSAVVFMGSGLGPLGPPRNDDRGSGGFTRCNCPHALVERI